MHRAVLAALFTFAWLILAANAHGGELTASIDSEGRLVVSDGTTRLIFDGDPSSVTYRLLGLSLGEVSEVVTSGTFEPVPVDPPPIVEPPPAEGAALTVRSEPAGTGADLAGAILEGAVYVELAAVELPITQVRFSLNGVQTRIEENPPWDFLGGQPGAPNPWATTSVADGVHEIRAEYDTTSGTQALVAQFLVANSPTGPPVEPPPVVEPPISGGQARASVESDGIEWHFEGEPVVWQFVNGDWWVPAGTVVTSVSPGWDGARGGSMVNPAYINDKNGNKQGYDTALASFSTAARATFPLTMQPGTSLVSTWSWREGEPGCPPINPTRGTPRPLVRRAAVLTCTAIPPAPGELRPPYAGAEKWRLNASQLIDLGQLPEWPLPADAPSVSSVISNFDALWLDHRGQWHCQFYAPSESMPDYDRNQAAEVGDLLLLLCSDIPPADKREVALRLCQVGIDQLGVHKSVEQADWGNGAGGHGSGRRAPVIVTGHLLGWAEARQFFIGRSIKDSLETVQVARDEQGLYWRERTTNTRADPGKTAYRKCCTACAWIGHVMAIRALGLEVEWSFADSFPYQDDYEADGGLEGYERAWHGWHGSLWDDTDGGRHAP